MFLTARIHISSKPASILITNNRPNAGFTLRDHKRNETAGEQLDVANEVDTEKHRS
jgi:hypothetical protein